jgi:hypothetical protein
MSVSSNLAKIFEEKSESAIKRERERKLLYKNKNLQETKFSTSMVEEII